MDRTRDATTLRAFLEVQAAAGGILGATPIFSNGGATWLAERKGTSSSGKR